MLKLSCAWLPRPKGAAMIAQRQAASYVLYCCGKTPPEGDKSMSFRSARWMIVPVAAVSLSACGINSVPTKEEAAKAQWANVEAAYQRRADLIPNLDRKSTRLNSSH